MQSPAQGGGQRHGDSLANRDTPSIRDTLDAETCERVAAACRFTSLQSQVRRQSGLANFYRGLADLFDGASSQ